MVIDTTPGVAALRRSDRPRRRRGSDHRRPGYVPFMLVAVLIPVLLLIATMLMERFETQLLDTRTRRRPVRPPLRLGAPPAGPGAPRPPQPGGDPQPPVVRGRP